MIQYLKKFNSDELQELVDLVAGCSCSNIKEKIETQGENLVQNDFQDYYDIIIFNFETVNKVIGGYKDATEDYLLEREQELAEALSELKATQDLESNGFDTDKRSIEALNKKVNDLIDIINDKSSQLGGITRARIVSGVSPRIPSPSIPSTLSGRIQAPSITSIAGATASMAVLGGLIASHESMGVGGYNAYNKGTVGNNRIIGSDKKIDFSKITISEYFRRSKLPTYKNSVHPDRLFAVGKYQIIPTTMEGAVKALNLDPNTTYLTPEVQDKIFFEYLIGSKRTAVRDYISGKSDNLPKAVLQLAQEFASIGVPYDTRGAKRQVKKGESYYSGVGGNVAKTKPEDVAKILTDIRNENLAKSRGIQPQPTTPKLSPVAEQPPELLRKPTNKKTETIIQPIIMMMK